MLDFCEREGLLYAFGYSNHKGIKPRTGWFLEQLKLYYRFYPEERVQRFDEITDYQASSWNHPRRLIVKTEINPLGTNQRLVVTNLSGSAKGLYHGFYAQRGNVPERPIGEMKNGLGCDRLSSPRFLANFQKLLAHVLSYAIVVLFRESLRAAYSQTVVQEGSPEAAAYLADVSTEAVPRADQTTPVVRVGQGEGVAVARVRVVRVPAGQIGTSESSPQASPAAASPSPPEASSGGSSPVPPPVKTVEQILQEAEIGRRVSLGDVCKWEVSTLRSQLFKVGALVKTSVRRIWFHFSSHWPRQELFSQVCQAVTTYVEGFRQRLAFSTGPPG
jgi:hypothetical protein